MYIPLPSIIQVLLYLAIIKLVFFFINVLMMDARWYERKWITKYPIMVEVFLDYGIVSYLLCDAFELAVVYYYSSLSWHQRIQLVLSAFGFQHFSL